MKLSELITELQTYIVEHGDDDVAMCHIIPAGIYSKLKGLADFDESNMLKWLDRFTEDNS